MIPLPDGSARCRKGPDTFPDTPEGSTSPGVTIARARRKTLLVHLSVALLAGAIATLCPTAAAGQEAGPEIVLQPGDILRVLIWREQELSGEFLVNENGVVTLPLLGDRGVVGMPVPALRDSLISLYRVELRNPSIEVTPLRRIYVLGEVNRPGLHVVDPTMSLAGAVGLAGGANQMGNIRKIRVIRGGEVIMRDVSIETALAAADIRSGDQIFIDRRSWFERNSTILISAALGFTSIVISLLR